MNFKSWRWISLCLYSLTILISSPVTAADKPNMLILWGDDIGTWNLSAYNLGLSLIHI